MPGAAVGLPPCAVGLLVGVGPVAPAALGAPPDRESAAALGTFPHPWEWVPLACQSDWGFFSQFSLASATGFS